MEIPKKAAGLAMAWSLFIIVALIIGIVLLIRFAITIPEYRYAAILFIVMCTGMTIQRIVRLKSSRQDRAAGGGLS